MNYSRMHNYPLGSMTIGKYNEVKIKRQGAQGKEWVRYSRYLAEQKLGRELEQNEKAYRIDSTKPDSPENFVIHRYNRTRFIFNAKSKPIYVPPNGMTPISLKVLSAEKNKNVVANILKELSNRAGKELKVA